MAGESSRGRLLAAGERSREERGRPQGRRGGRRSIGIPAGGAGRRRRAAQARPRGDWGRGGGDLGGGPLAAADGVEPRCSLAVVAAGDRERRRGRGGERGSWATR